MKRVLRSGLQLVADELEDRRVIHDALQSFRAWSEAKRQDIGYSVERRLVKNGRRLEILR